MNKGESVTILLVEDDDIDAKGIIRSFTKRRIANPIVRAKNGLEALELLNEGLNRPYIILLDLQMPRMNGLEFLEALRKDPKLQDCVVFVLTTSKAEQDIVASYDQQIAGYFVKGEVGESFSEIIDMLEGYWKIAYLKK